MYTFAAPAQPDGMTIDELEILLIDGTSVRLALGMAGHIYTILLPNVARP